MEFKKKNYLTNAINKTNILISNNNKQNNNDLLLNNYKNKFYTKKRHLSIYNYNNFNTNIINQSEKKFF